MTLPDHGGTNKFVCEEEGCGKSYRSVGLLAQHYISHTQSDQFKCEQCGRHFLDASKLDRHRVVHTGEYNHARFARKRFCTTQAGIVTRAFTPASFHGYAGSVAIALFILAPTVFTSQSANQKWGEVRKINALAPRTARKFISIARRWTFI